MQYHPISHGTITVWVAQTGDRTVVVGEDRLSPEGNPSSSWELRLPGDPDEDPGMTAFVYRDTLEECHDYDPADYVVE